MKRGEYLVTFLVNTDEPVPEGAIQAFPPDSLVSVAPVPEGISKRDLRLQVAEFGKSLVKREVEV